MCAAFRVSEIALLGLWRASRRTSCVARASVPACFPAAEDEEGSLGCARDDTKGERQERAAAYEVRLGEATLPEMQRGKSHTA